MSYAQLRRSELGSLPVYQPGKPIELVARELGLNPSGILKLASNENPLGCPPSAKEAVRAAVESSWLYPDNAGYFLTQKISQKFGFQIDQIILGAGSNEIFYLLCDAFVDKNSEVIVGEYAFISYLISAMLAGGNVIKVGMPAYKHDLDAMREAITEKTKLIFLPNPNNPTGTVVEVEAVEKFARSLPDHVILCYDEAYYEYENSHLDVNKLVQQGVKIIGTRTFSKIYGLAGLRIGYGYGDPELIKILNSVRPPFNTSNVAQAAAIAALEDEAWVALSRSSNTDGMKQLQKGFQHMGMATAGESGNFILVEVDQADHICEQLMKSGIIVRPVSGYGLKSHLRFSVGTRSQNEWLLEKLEEIHDKEMPLPKA